MNPKIKLPRNAAIISDLDGVTYRGDAPIASAVQAFRRWHDEGLPYAFVTNNSTKSADEFSEKLNALGIAALPERIITSSMVLAKRLRADLPAGARVMVIGAPSLIEAVAAQGFTIDDQAAEAVVVGLDRAFTFEKLRRAQSALLAGASFYGTNPDAMLPHGDSFEPGAGSLLAAIETASGVSPTIIGKPQPDLVHMALQVLGSDPRTTFMLGDQIETDIMAGRSAGLKTILVRTGVPPKQMTGIVPDIDVETLLELDIDFGT